MCDHVLQPAAQEQQRPEVALIVGGGPGISGACARLFAAEGMRVAIAARSPDKLEIQEIIEASMVSGGSVRAFKCDVSDTASVEALFAVVEAELGPPDVVIYNPSGRARGPVAELDPEEVKQSLLVMWRVVKHIQCFNASISFNFETRPTSLATANIC